MKIRILAALAITTLLISGTSVAANADTGDRTIQNTNTLTILQTNKCEESSAQTISFNGGDLNPQDISVNVYASKPGCVTRARLSYLRNLQGTQYLSSYYYARYSGDRHVSFGGTNIYRCYTEVGVQRDNGTYFTRFQISDRATRVGCDT